MSVHYTLDSLLGHEVDTPQTSVRVRRGEGHEAVGEVVGRDDVAQLATQLRGGTQRSIPVTHDAGKDHHGEVVGRLPSDTFNGDSDVERRHGVVSDSDFGTGEDGLGMSGLAERDRVRGLRQRGKVLLGQLAELLVVNGTSTDKDHSVSGVVVLDVRLQVGLLDRVDVLLRAQDGVAQGLTGESDGVQVVKDNFLELLVDFLLLAQNDVSFTLDSLLLQLGVLQNVGDDTDGAADVLLESLGIVDSLFSRRVGVQVGAHVFNFQLERSLVSALGALEGHVLETTKDQSMNCGAMTELFVGGSPGLKTCVCSAGRLAFQHLAKYTRNSPRGNEHFHWPSCRQLGFLHPPKHQQ